MTPHDRQRSGDALSNLGPGRLRGALVGLAALGAVALMTGRNPADEPARHAAMDPIAEAAVNDLLKEYPRAKRRYAERPYYQRGATIRRLELKASSPASPRCGSWWPK